MNGQHENLGSSNSRSAIQRLERHVWQRLSRGLLVLIPLLITILIVEYLVAGLKSFFHTPHGLLIRLPFIEGVPAISIIAWIVLASVVLAIF